jgi:arsenite-transporting ATPase
MDPNIPTSVNAALRYWGCTLQAGAQVSGAIGISSPRFNEESLEGVKKNFLPLPFAFIPHLSKGYPPEWNSVMLNTVGHDARTLFSLPASHSNSMAPPVKFDAAEKSVTLFMPGFDKSEIKLYQVYPFPSYVLFSKDLYHVSQTVQICFRYFSLQ